MMYELLNKKNTIILLIVLPIWVSSLITIYEKRSIVSQTISNSISINESDDSTSLDESINNFMRNECYTDKACVDENIYWANEIMNGGYILHVRHAERDKWIDVQMYDALESDVHSKGINESRLAENDYFKNAVCLNERGVIQARAIGEHLENIGFPIGYIISSPICRSRQTAEIAFGGYDSLDRTLVHKGPYRETVDQHVKDLKNLYSNLPIEKGKNTIVSSHNGVIHPDMFETSVLDTDQYDLEEGGFYVISVREGKLFLEHSFYYFNDFIKTFYLRG